VQGHAVGKPLPLDQVTPSYAAAGIRLGHHCPNPAPPFDRAGSASKDPSGSEPGRATVPARTLTPIPVTPAGA
jgi:hypothetical protein